MVSIITPAYNAEKYIRFTIESVISQTYGDWEMLIVDDCSTDETKKIICEYQNRDNRIKYIATDEKLFLLGARNKAIKEAKGRFIAFIDSDDCWYPNKLESQIKFMIDNLYSFTFTYYNVIDSNGNLNKGVVKSPEKVVHRDFYYKNQVGILTVIIDSEKLGKFYFQKGTPKGVEDYSMWFEITKMTNGYCLETPLSYYRVHSHSMSSNKIANASRVWELYRKNFKMNVFYSLFNFSIYTILGIKKYISLSISKIIGKI